MVMKIRRSLTKEQKEKGIIFTSTLTENRSGEDYGTTHVVYANQPDKYEQIRRLKDDKFFNSSHYRYNIIRE